MKQLNLNLYKGKRGGRRPGSGRKKTRSQGVSHDQRLKVTGRTPLHINFKYRMSIRNKAGLNLLKRAIQNARSHGLKIIHFSLQSNHVHILAEAPDNRTLTVGMRSMTVTFAKGLNQGKVQIERYHLHILKTLREVKYAYHYVLFNQQKHSGLKTAHIDDYSSLGVVKELGNLAKNAQMRIVMKKIIKIMKLDSPMSWLLQKAVT